MLIASLLLTAGLVLLFYRLPLPLFLACTHPFAQRLAPALLVTLVIDILAGLRLLIKRHRIILAVASPGLILLVLWLGYYPWSPLGFSHVLHGFVVIAGSNTSTIQSGSIITLRSGAVNAIEPIVFPDVISCEWISSYGGALDDPHSCDTVYAAPGSDFDILRVRLQPICNLPPSFGEIKVSISP
jgi:hypothetical protein